MPTSITMSGGKLNVPNEPIIPFIEGDGTGPDIWRASVRVFDAAVAKAYSGKRRIHWKEVYAGEKAFNKFRQTLGDTKAWLPDETLDAFRAHLVGIVLPEGANLSSAAGAAYNVTAVPEPGEWVLMLAGLGLVGWRVRRRA